MPSELKAKLATHKAKGGKRYKRDDLYVQIPVRTIAAVSGLLNEKWALVWAFIHHRVGATGKDTVEIGNVGLREWGVDSDTKIRALRAFERAGLVSVEWRGRTSPLVTLRPDLSILKIRSTW